MSEGLRLPRRMVPLTTVMAWMLALTAALLSAQPQQQPGLTQQQVPPDIRGADQSLVVVRLQPPSKAPEEAAKEQRQNDQQASDRDWTRGVAVFTGLTAILQVLLLGFQLRIYSRQRDIMESQRELMTGQLDAAKKSADAASANAEAASQQAGIALTAHKTNVKIRRLTKLSAKAANQSARTADKALLTNREIERAYIAMSHRDILFLESSRITPARPTVDDENPDSVDLVIEIRNFGRTPGDVLGGYCSFIFLPARIGPDLAKATGGTHLVPAFLVPHPDGMVNFAVNIKLSREAIRRLMNERPGPDDNALWIVGHVDYRDRFRRIHRGGYGRVFSKDARNFVFDPSTKDLNYDRPLSQGEIKQREYES